MSGGTGGAQPVRVSGGSGGIAANGADLLHLSLSFGAAAHALDDARGQLAFPLLGPMSAGLGPFAAPGLEAQALLAGAHEQVRAALFDLQLAARQCAAVSGALVRAALHYDLADGGIGRDIAAMARGVTRGVGVGEATLFGTGSPSQAGQAALTDDPDLDYAVLRTLGLAAQERRVQAQVADDGPAVAVPTGIDGGAARPPRALADLVDDLARRNDDGRHGEIDVRVLTMPDGSRRAVVDITGVKSWSVRPSRDVADLRTCVLALDGRESAYERGVLAALHQAGVTKDDDVMLVGHSLGGMVAVDAAARAARTGEFRVTHVVTAGSPVGRTAARLPAGTQLLALEDRHDVVPALDGRANPDRPNVTTVTSGRGDGTVHGDHDLHGTYEPIAGDVAASRNRSARQVLGSMRGYFGATSVTTHTYQIRRA